MSQIVHVSPQYFGDKGVWGGGERYALELARSMSHLRPTRLVSFGAERETFEVDDLRVDLVPTRCRVRGSRLDPVSEKLFPLLRGAKLVHVHQYASYATVQAVAIARVLRIPVCVTDLGWGSGAATALRVLRLDRRINAMIAISQFSSSFFPEFGSRRAVIYGGYDESRCYPNDGPRQAEVVFVGRLMPHKGVDVLIKAMPPNAPLRIFGRPYDREFSHHLRDLAGRKDVTFYEDADDAQVADAYRRARVVVLPSLHRATDGSRHPKPELLGLTLIEAMACGTPVIGSDAGSLPEVVEHGRTGWIVPQNDPVALRSRLEQLLADDDTWQTMSERAVARVRANFTWQRVTDRCLDAYRYLLAV